MRNACFTQKQAKRLLGGLAFIAVFAAALSTRFPNTKAPLVESALLMCNDPEPITRWNKLTAAQRSALNDNDPLTNVTGFNTGFENAANMPILVDISVTGAPNSGQPAVINNRFANRWGLKSFNNARESGMLSGNKYCFTFSEPLPVQVNSQEHLHFQNHEHIRVTAFNGMATVNLTGALHGPADDATVSGSGTAEVHFDAENKRGGGLWWDASSGADAVTQVCVEYYRESPGAGYYGREPFSLLICNSDRAIFDDPFALDANGGGPPIVDFMTMSKEIRCINQAASGTAGNVDVTLHLNMTNHGTSNLTDLQIEDDLEDHFPGSCFVDFISVAIHPSSTAAIYPSVNPAYDGENAIQVFNGGGLLEPDDSIVVDITIEMDPSDLAPYEFAFNQSFGYGIDPNGRNVSATSDALDGIPGNTPNGEADGTLIYIPNLNLTTQGVNAEQSCATGSGDVIYSIHYYIENTGNTNVDRISVTDNLQTEMGSLFAGIQGLPQIIASTATQNPNINAAFQGFGGNSNLFDGMSGLLEPGQKITVQVKVITNPNAAGAPASPKNSAIITGRGINQSVKPLPACTSITDVSDAGSQPHTQNSSACGNTGGSNDPACIAIPAFVVATHIAGVDYATSGTAGRYDAILEVIAQNTGNTPLTNLSLMTNLPLAANLGTTFVAVRQAPQIVAAGTYGNVSDATVNPIVNNLFNGVGDLLTGGGMLNPGQTIVVRFRIEINPTAGGAPPSPKYQFEGFAGYASSLGIWTVSDLSDSGYIPESNNPGRPGNTGGTCDPTPVTNCAQLVTGALTCNNLVQVSLNQNCIAGITPEMILEGEYQQCTGDLLFPLGGYYDLMITTLGDIPVPDLDPSTPNVYEVSGAYIGQTLYVKAIEVVNKNACWGQIKLEDKLPPVFNCPSTPVQLSCSANLNNIPAPVATDNCDATPTVAFVGEQIIDKNICDDGMYIIRRHWKAFDDSGNMTATNCLQDIKLTRPAVEFPKDITWQCSQFSSHPTIVNSTDLNAAITDVEPADPDIDVSPTLAANILANTGSGNPKNTGGVCMFNVSKSDQTVTSCGTAFKIIRTWTVLDWCSNSIITTGANGEDNQQIIKIIDETGPMIARAPFTVSANEEAAHPQPCRSTGFLLPPTTLTDNCNAVTIRIITPNGEAIYVNNNPALGGFIPSPGLPLGVHVITYEAKDACGNVTTLNVNVTVVDDITPTAICDKVTEASLSSNGIAEVFASTFDDGSHDNCCLDKIEVRRMTDNCNDGHNDTVFGNSVFFCCADVTPAPVMVVFRAYDCHGNVNDCMVEVTVKDKINPQNLTCPADMRITCDQYDVSYKTQLAALAGNPTAQSQLLDGPFGAPTFFDNCSFTVTRTFSLLLDQCMEGTIVRTWLAQDPTGQTTSLCDQYIFIDHVSDFVVEFPADLSVDCGNALPSFGNPEIFYKTCEITALTHHDAVANDLSGACFKVIRTWTYINWCVTGADVDNEVVESSEMAFQAAFPMQPCDFDGDGDCDSRTFRDSWRVSPLAKPAAAQATQTTGPDTDPDTDPWDGVIVYEQVMKVVDTVDPVLVGGCPVIPEVEILGNDCFATVNLPQPNVMDCSDMVLTSVVTTLPNGVGLGPYTNVMPGTYTVTYTIEDQCNNDISCSTTVTVSDNKGPGFLCSAGLSVPIGNTQPPSVTVFASSLAVSASDNCGGTITFAFSTDDDDDSMTFSCTDVGMTFPVTIYGFDENGNFSTCNSMINVTANGMICGDDGLVAGAIAKENGQPVENVEVSMSGQSDASLTTSENGQFVFQNVPLGNDLTITPYKDDFPLNGITTFDLVLISQHILSVQRLDSPYKMIAADVNKSNSVTTFDLVELRKLVLLINDDFPNNTSWRFVRKDYVFPNPANPWTQPFPEVISINNMPTDELEADFVAIKIGDVNGSASGNYNDPASDRNAAGSLVILANDGDVKANETFTLDFAATTFEATGYQFSLAFDPAAAELLNMEPGLANESNFGYAKLDEGVLTTSWHSEEPIWLEQGESLFRLHFRAKKALRLSDVFHLDDRYTPAEAYDADGQLLDVSLTFGQTNQQGQFELFQNKPNPFRQNTVISFFLPEPSQTTLTLTDLSGQVIKVITGNYGKGYHEIEVKRSELGNTGVFYYQLDTPQHTAVRKAVLIE